MSADYASSQPQAVAELLARVEDAHHAVLRERDQAREQAAECMREAAQLHKALDSLGTSPEKLAQQVGAGMAVTLYGRVYVARELAHLVLGEHASAEPLEAQSGVFVPIPAGHMLSVTVTPYDSTPLPDED